MASGDTIALCGRTGSATTEHLHFEIRVQGQTFNPALMVDFENRALKNGVVKVTKKANGIFASNGGLSPEESVHKPEVPSEPLPLEPEKSVSSTSNSVAAAYHTIIKGDTLYGLSRKYSTTVAAICKLNGMTEKSILGLGKKLRVK